MLRIVCVHGVGNYRPLDPSAVRREQEQRLGEALAKGLRVAARAEVAYSLTAAYYAHVLRRTGAQGAGEDRGTAALEVEVLQALAGAWRMPDDLAQGLATATFRTMVDWVARWVGRDADDGFRRRLAALLTNFVRDTASYLGDAGRRHAAQEQLLAVLESDGVDVLVAHSLGTVVAYEALWRRPDLRVPSLMTLGTPLGLAGAIFDRLTPPPRPDARTGKGRIPPGVGRWLNYADSGDIVAVPKRVHRWFDGLNAADDHQVSNGSLDFHSFAGYLRTGVVAAAVTDTRTAA